jgi:hypothetical protein
MADRAESKDGDSRNDFKRGDNDDVKGADVKSISITPSEDKGYDGSIVASAKETHGFVMSVLHIFTQNNQKCFAF